jgi:excisionase family DNA binding protein
MTETKDKSPFVTIESLAQYFCVSVSTIRAWVRQGHIPENTYIKLGNTYRFNRAAVEQALMGMHKDEEPTARRRGRRCRNRCGSGCGG